MKRFILLAILLATQGVSAQRTPGSGLPPDALWTHCANEGELCKVPPNAKFVRYGTGGKYVEFETWGRGRGPRPGPTGDVQCSLANMGGVDPYPNVHKQCYYYIESRRSGYDLCAREGQICQAQMGDIVVYGVMGRFTQPVKVSRPVLCGLLTFGVDPAYGVQKSCYISRN